MASDDQSKIQQYAGVIMTLENCLLTEEEVKNSPSQKEGLTAEQEATLRHLGCEFIQISGITLRVPQFAVACAQVMFQRFYCIKSFIKNKMEEVAMACIWLASKVEEAPRRLRDVINVFHLIKQKLDDPKCTPGVKQLDGAYIALKQRVIKYERRLLKELGFCVHFKHPHKVIIVFLQVLGLESNVDLVQTSWNYMNDSMRTTLFVQYSPETIACACICLAARVLQVPTPNNPPWFEAFDATQEDIVAIAHSLMHIYHHRKHITPKMATEIVDKFKEEHEAKNKPKEEVIEGGTATLESSGGKAKDNDDKTKAENGVKATASDKVEEENGTDANREEVEDKYRHEHKKRDHHRRERSHRRSRERGKHKHSHRRSHKSDRDRKRR